MNKKQGQEIDKYRKYIPFVILVAMIALVITVITGEADTKGGHKKQNTTTTESAGIAEVNTLIYDRQAFAVVKAIDTDKKSITLYSIDGNDELNLYYDGATDVKDKFDQVITMAQIPVGELVDVYYLLNNDVVAINISKDAWEYKKVSNLVINSDKKMMSIANQNYQYNENLLIIGDGKAINMINLNEKDELTLKGVGSNVYSIIVTKGHGYVRFSNYDDFIGGNLEIGNDNMIQISKDMLVVVREGDYRLTMENDGLTGSKLIHVTRDEEIVVDMGEFRKEAPQVGKVEFTVIPDGADLTINGKEVDYSQPIELKYGQYTVTVTLSGYEDYTGKITVDESSMQFFITLVEPAPEATDDSTSTNTNNSTGTNSSTSSDTNSSNNSSSSDDSLEEEVKNSDTSNNSVDTEHKIYVQTPADVSVYWNGDLMGTAPVNFTKQVGSYTISLAADGYETVSYPVIIADDGEDVYLNFPSLTKK
ncbi:PEGA domain-containing protein [Anaerosporobacter faecicola]|uniref:PEGA domain-containing protein n=1 Tax=Anaerosporobacter faecicola TaxID=2718714 RepID=UPI0014391B69|nr:PEGA domain-containing protein [Anaerosporobacter faecicola]